MAPSFFRVGLGFLVSGAFLTLSGCPSRARTYTSVDEHEAAAAGAEREAAAHETAAQACGEAGACWSDLTAEDHLAQASRDREAAAQHRREAATLREAEARVCVGLSDRDRDVSPFAHRADVGSVSRLEEERPAGRQMLRHLVGATVVFRAVPGLTMQWLQRVIDCHLARNEAMGYAMPEMSFCPIALPDVAVRVHATETGFAVSIRSEDDDVAAEVLRRARALVEGTYATDP